MKLTDKLNRTNFYRISKIKEKKMTLIRNNTLEGKLYNIDEHHGPSCLKKTDILMKKKIF